MKTKRLLAAALAAATLVSLTACGGTATTAQPATTADSTAATENETPIDSSAFVPSLPTDTAASLQITGFLGNFEALDQVMNSFNEIYPNVQFSYDQNSNQKLSEYLQNNADVDIFMTTEQNITRADIPENYVADRCVDLLAADINLSAIRSDVLAASETDGKLLRIPVAMNPCGLVVNKTLLKNEGLEVPANYEQFLTVLAALKEKGYTPIQGSDQHVYHELMVNMLLDTLRADDTLLPALQAGDDKALTAVTPVFERLGAVIENGYTDYELNCTFGVDNYDSTIMAFYEGNMPFYVCTAECFSGMKKRESKSENYSANPFEYEFMYAPVGDSGAFAYEEPWYGFSINKDSDVKDMAVEFLRFMTCSDQIEKMASIKGMPAVNTNAVDERYPGLKDTSRLEADYIADGSIPETVWGNFAAVARDYGAGVYTSAEEAAKAFVDACKA